MAIPSASSLIELIRPFGDVLVRGRVGVNHPNICVLHDVGSQDDTEYRVMEYLEGETLAARIAKGTLPVDLAIKFAIQMADALDLSHRAGITHRDVKPAP